MEENEIKVGMMTKRSQQKKSYGPVNYKERVFVLTSSKLAYYEGTIYKRGKVKGSFPVSTISFVGPITDRALNRTSAFQIIHNDCYLYCCAKSLDERDEWMNAIKQACSMQRNFLHNQYHPNIYNGGMWQCCGKPEKNAKGCQTSSADHSGPRLNKPLPQDHFPPMTKYPAGGVGVMGGYFKHEDEPPPVQPRQHQHTPFPHMRGYPQEDETPPAPPVRVEKPNKPVGDSSYPCKSNNLRFSSHQPQHHAPWHAQPQPQTSNHHHQNSRDNLLLEPPVRSYGAGSQYKESLTQAQTIKPALLKNYLPVKLKDLKVTQQQDETDSVVALYDFEPQEAGDVGLVADEVYTVLETSRPHWWKVRNKRGEEGYVPANYVKYRTKDGLETMSWFQRDMTRQRAEYLLKQDGKEGNFIVRNSSQPSVVYTLSIVTKGGQINGPAIVKHYHIRKNQNDEFYLSEKHFLPTIKELINYHKHNAGGLVTRLRQAPVSIAGNSQPATHLFSNSHWEIDINELQFMKELGSGQFGVVQLASIRGKQLVAVKIMKEGTMEEDHFIEEAEVMTKLTHPNLVELYGVVVKQRPICIVTEFMEEGCLLDYIRKHTHLQNHPETLLDMSCQICSAMKYLETNNLIHRDLAARNCLVGKNMLVKVADFGLTRYVLDDEYTSSLGSKFPIKWAAPEVLNCTKFSSKSDVWAFGILMWELFTGGKMPYRALSNTEVVERVAVGHRLERPQSCPHDVYLLMLKTWDMEPEKRPSFEILSMEIEDIVDVVNAACMPEGMYDVE